MTQEAFLKESDISESFSVESCIRSKFGYTHWKSWQVRELSGLFGIPDHVAVFWKRDVLGRRITRTFAFEVKRNNWRQGLMQAYRYASFADYSFVVLDHSYIHRALAYLEEFRNANIGLLSVRVDGECFWHLRPRYRLPYSNHMRAMLNAGLSIHLFKEHISKPSTQFQWIV